MTSVQILRRAAVVAIALSLLTATPLFGQAPAGAAAPAPGGAAPATGNVPNGYVGKWKGIRGKATANSRGRVGTAIVNKDFGHVIDKFEFEVAADGTITGTGTATYWFDITADADLIVTRTAPEAHLEGKSQAVTFKITGKMVPGRAELIATPDAELVLINAGKRTTMGAWNVFGHGRVLVSKTDMGLEIGASRVIEELGMKLEWEARKVACPNPLDVAKDLAATKYDGWTYGSSAADQQVDCVQFVLAVVEKLHGEPLPRATQTRIKMSDVPPNTQVLVPANDSRTKGVQQALVDIDHGTVVSNADVQPGDFVQYWMKDGKGNWAGHSAVVAEVLKDSAGTPNRIRIYGAQSSDGGIALYDTPIRLSGGGRKMYLVRYKCESSQNCCQQ